MSRAEALLRTLVGSAYAALAVPDDLLVDVVAGDWAARVRSPGGRVSVVHIDDMEGAGVDAQGPALDGRIRCSAADLDRMLARLPPEAGVTLAQGTRDIAPRRRQAHLVLVAAALGWDGPWPSTATVAVGHRTLLVEALCDLAIGPRDHAFMVGGLPVRGTDTAAGLTLLLDAGVHAVRLDLRSEEAGRGGPDRGGPEPQQHQRALTSLARLGLRIRAGGPPRGDAWFGGERWTFCPDPAFPRGWTMPDGVGGVWLVKRG